MRGPLGVQWVYIHALSHGCCFYEGELKQLKTKRLSHYSPALEFVHLLREKKCYSLYAAAEKVDHFKFKRGHIL